MDKRLQGAVYFRLGRDIRIFIIFLAALFNQPLFALIVIALIMNIEVVRRIFVCMTDETE
jgi:CDP-L-myo-inositol myo-inositolphosphotransferase